MNIFSCSIAKLAHWIVLYNITNAHEKMLHGRRDGVACIVIDTCWNCDILTLLILKKALDVYSRFGIGITCSWFTLTFRACFTKFNETGRFFPPRERSRDRTNSRAVWRKVEGAVDRSIERAIHWSILSAVDWLIRMEGRVAVSRQKDCIRGLQGRLRLPLPRFPRSPNHKILHIPRPSRQKIVHISKFSN